MARSSNSPRDSGGADRTPSSDRRREQTLKLQLAVLVVLIVGALIYNWYEQRAGSEPATGQAKVEQADVTTPAARQRPSQPAAAEDEPATAAANEPRDKETTKPQRGKSPAKKKAEPAEKKSTVIENVSIKDIDGKVIFRGQIDLQPTLDRIADGQRLRFPNDGSTFQNREGRLPQKPSGYYQEWVHPTPKQDGPGPQRVVTGKEGEVFYTHDHYRSFKRVQ